MEQAPRPAKNEVDLLGLLIRLWRERHLMLAVFIAIFLLALTYAVLAPAVYQGRAVLLPPRPSDIAAFNLGRGGAELDLFNKFEVYSVFTRNLTSISLRNDFFHEVFLPSLSSEERGKSSEDELREEFSEMLQVLEPDERAKRTNYEVIVQHKNPKLAAEWANSFVDRAGKLAMVDMQQQIREEISTRTTEINRRISNAREFAQLRRQDRIERLRESLVVAEAVGIERPVSTLGNLPAQGDISSFVTGSQLYMTGALAIRTELEVLKNRESDDPFIADLRDMQERLTFLNSIQIAPEGVAVYTLDAPAIEPHDPVKPNRVLIIVLGIMLGGMLALFTGVVRALLRALKDQA